MSRGTTKPCPICHKGPKDGRFRTRPTDGICHHCDDEIQRLREMELELSAQSKEMKPYYTHNRSYALPHVSVHSENFEAKDKLQELFWELSQRVSLPLKETTDQAEALWSEYGSEYLTASRWRETRLFRPEQARLIGELFNAVRRFLANEYEQGKKDGKRILSQLASGEITSAQFDAEVER